jgi:hypothetical protein
VVALVRDAGGLPVVNGTLVSFTASSGGGLSTGSLTTVNGQASVTFTGTTNSVANITAASGGVSKGLTINVNCPTSPSAPPLPPAAPADPPIVIIPPRTGDGGLVTTTDWRTYVAFGIMGVSILGLFAAARGRS